MAFISARRLLEGGVYFAFLFLNAAFIGGQRLKDEIRYSNIFLENTVESRYNEI